MFITKAFVGAIGKNATIAKLKTSAFDDYNSFSTNNTQIFWYELDKAKPINVTHINNTFCSGRPFGQLDTISVNSSDSELLSLDGKFSLSAIGFNELLLATDIFSAGQLYYRSYDDTLYYSDCLGLLLSLSQGPVKPNKLGIAALCAGRIQLTSETHIKDIFRLEACGLIKAKYDADTYQLQFTVSSYSTVLDCLTLNNNAITSVEEFDEKFAESIYRENYHQNSTIMLSGGRDSRAIALAISTNDFSAVTYGSRLSLDVYWAKKFAKKLGLNHIVLPYNTWDYEAFLDLLVSFCGGGQGLQIANNLIGFNTIKSKHQLAIVGFMGDPTMGSHIGPTQYVSDESFKNLLLSRMQYSDAHLINKYFSDELDTLGEIIHKKIQSYHNEIPLHQVHRILDFSIRQSTWISGMFSMCSVYVPLSYPFFYRPLLSGMFQANFDDLNGQNLYDRWLTYKQNKLGIKYIKDNSTLRLYSLMVRILKGSHPQTRVYWPEITRRSKSFIDNLDPSGIEYLDRLTRESSDHSMYQPVDESPLLTITVPLQQTFRRWS